MVRFTSTERAKQGESASSLKYARDSRLSMAKQIRRYREECQRIFDLQNRVLSNPELLSSDEEEEEEESSSEEEDRRYIQSVTKMSNGSTGGGVRSGPTNFTSSVGGPRVPSSAALGVRVCFKLCPFMIVPYLH